MQAFTIYIHEEFEALEQGHMIELIDLLNYLLLFKNKLGPLTRFRFVS
jgi:hypothetical protein